ncbi:hypothetical protein CLV60_10137 [Dyadobacter jiangsuensis]|uniref:Uncharacterized protein n=1 Tax=Dyadobacter jiangsuensis TaxID=1591085 RepID=A0A2P8GI85_9BACT|nr:hypothetical protein CLV60_10137 [Dyadobacter jiangsuensis]
MTPEKTYDFINCLFLHSNLWRYFDKQFVINRTIRGSTICYFSGYKIYQ